MKNKKLHTHRGRLALWSLVILQFALFLGSCKTCQKHDDPQPQQSKYGVPSSYIDTVK
jgi:hypothetical protein